MLQNQSTTPKIGSVILLRGETAPSLVWRRGRIVDCHPAMPGGIIIRMVSIKTSTGIVKRALTRVIPLMEEEH